MSEEQAECVEIHVNKAKKRDNIIFYRNSFQHSFMYSSRNSSLVMSITCYKNNSKIPSETSTRKSLFFCGKKFPGSSWYVWRRKSRIEKIKEVFDRASEVIYDGILNIYKNHRTISWKNLCNKYWMNWDINLCSDSFRWI